LLTLSCNSTILCLPTMKCPFTAHLQHARNGFTMVELLIVIAMIGILTAIVVPAASSLQGAANATTELAAARRTTQAWRNWSIDHNGRLIASQLEPSAPLPPNVAPTHHNGTLIPDIARRRWLWRLWDYFEDPVQTIWAGGQRRWWDSVMDGPGDMTTKLYVATLHPCLGLNGEWLGGRQSNDSDTWTLSQYMRSQDELAVPLFTETLAQLKRPADLTLFASARGSDTASGGQPIEGWWRIEPPYRPGMDQGQLNWTTDDSGAFVTPTATSQPSDAGFVSARHGGRSVIAAPDGSARVEHFGRLGDMRRWADPALSHNWSPAF